MVQDGCSISAWQPARRGKEIRDRHTLFLLILQSLPCLFFIFFFNPSFEDYVIVFYSFWKSYFADNGSEALVERELKSYGDLIIGRESCKKKITELLC